MSEKQGWVIKHDMKEQWWTCSGYRGGYDPDENKAVIFARFCDAEMVYKNACIFSGHIESRWYDDSAKVAATVDTH